MEDPRDRPIKPTFKAVSQEFGTLAESAPASPEESGQGKKKKPRSWAERSKVSKQAGTTNHAYRKVGAKVHLFVEIQGFIGGGKQLSISRRDSKGSILPRDLTVKLNSDIASSMDDANMKAMKKFDRF